ncbi:MAG TPA: DNA alkylation repair protein [Caulobacteraceae bacterium]|nr:DNA alkylation repair protein [Caulobacteraceae bacterium]
MPELDVAAERAGLVDQLRAAGTPYRGGQQNDSYTGSGHPFFCVSVPNMRRIALAWLAAHRKNADADLLAVADRLFAGQHYEEKVLAAILLQTNARVWRQVTPAMVDRWLDDLNGWAEVDSLSGGAFWAAVMASDWPAWRALIQQLAGDPNINKRRAALVLLTAPTRVSDDPRFRDLAFEVVERLKGERPILITKAVSWLLRSMAPRHGPAVAAYLEANALSLPAIAVRETRTKLDTGTKTGRSRPAAASEAAGA